MKGADPLFNDLFDFVKSRFQRYLICAIFIDSIFVDKYGGAMNKLIFLGGLDLLTAR